MTSQSKSLPSSSDLDRIIDLNWQVNGTVTEQYQSPGDYEAAYNELKKYSKSKKRRR